MTRNMFKRKFAGVLDRAYEWCSKTGMHAPWPEYNKNGINVSVIEHSCRPKEYDITYDEESNIVVIDWLTQDNCYCHVEFDDEIARWIEDMGIRMASIHLHDRAGYDDFLYDIHV